MKVSYAVCRESTYFSLKSQNKLVQGRLYFVKDIGKIFRATSVNTAEEYGAVIKSEVVTIDSGIVELELQDTKVYSFTNNNIGSISLTVASDFSYCTICFTAGEETTWAVPNNARCIGYDCSGGIFSPVSGNEYQIAVDRLNNVLTFYVLNTGSLEAL